MIINEQKEGTRFIVVAGGVISGVGKGVATASIGKILKEYGYTVTIIKIDPYINYDAGTLRPTEHGEVWVTEDGGEIDQDLGTYERFLNIDIPKKNNITTGQIYKTVIDRERNGHYLGHTVQFIPHITDEVIARIKDSAHGYDIALIEIGGTVGDHENVPFLYALKALERELGRDYVTYILVTYLPVPGHIQEMKTKPTQQAIRLLGEQGILPDFIICRSEIAIDAVRKKKIEEFAHIASDRIISAPQVDSVYEVPLLFEKQELGVKLLKQLALHPQKNPDWVDWQKRVAVLSPSNTKSVRIGIVGKYLEVGDYSLTDSYLSIYHALVHAGAQLNTRVSVVWLNAHTFTQHNSAAPFFALEKLDGIIVPGGFGTQGVEGKINVINHARIHNIPYLGICYGMQLAVVEFARNVCKMDNAHTTEVAPNTHYPVVTLLDTQKELLDEQKYGASMRLGSYTCAIKNNSRVHNLYLAAQKCTPINDLWTVSERHRHRYEMNPEYVDHLSAQGLVFSGYHQRADGIQLMEFIELPEHRFFVATQAHPEFKSRFGDPNPLFYGLIEASLQSHGQ